MKKLVLIGGVFSGGEVEDSGDVFELSWCEKDGVKAEYALNGESRCYSDIYQKSKSDDGSEYYQFIKVTG